MGQLILPAILLYNPGVEKNNDDNKRHYFSSNRHDAAASMLRTEAILETLKHGTSTTPSCVRDKQPYTKHNVDYWKEGIFEARRNNNSDDTN